MVVVHYRVFAEKSELTHKGTGAILFQHQESYNLTKKNGTHNAFAETKMLRAIKEMKENLNETYPDGKVEAVFEGGSAEL